MGIRGKKTVNRISCIYLTSKSCTKFHEHSRLSHDPPLPLPPHLYVFNYQLSKQPSATVLRHVEIQESRDLGTDRSKSPHPAKWRLKPIEI
jgi:hypothetical protein